ncbi:conserved hypothetical protein, partial [Trichinella spiralis]
MRRKQFSESRIVITFLGNCGAECGW